MMQKNPTVALVLAGGRGTRAGSEVPKQYQKLEGKPLLRWSLDILCHHKAIDHVKVVIHPDDELHYRNATAGLKLLDPVNGGATRQESSRSGIQSFAELCPGIILIHDGARPFITPKLLDQLISELISREAVIPALKINDAVKEINQGLVRKNLPSSNLWRIQTPQAFHFDVIHSAYQQISNLDFRDDAAVAEHSGIKVHVIKGLEKNRKITFSEDFEKAANLISKQESKVHVVTGVDAHSFGSGDHIMLCGVTIPLSHGLIGHSDGDVAFHALVDALLSGINAGDIGQHFPSSDEKWRDRPSEEFLSYAMELVSVRGARINHIDLTIICNKPRISEFRDAMRDNTSRITCVPKKMISIKGTTTDGLGFTGRGEGIAAIVTVTMVIDDE